MFLCNLFINRWIIYIYLSAYETMKRNLLTRSLFLSLKYGKEADNPLEGAKLAIPEVLLTCYHIKIKNIKSRSGITERNYRNR